MRVWSRVRENDYRRLSLRAHTLLADVPVHDVWRVELPGGGTGRTIQDVRTLLGDTIRREELHAVVRALFGVRTMLGRVFGWDVPHPAAEKDSFRRHLTEQDLRESLVEPGAPDGPFKVLYVHAMESVSEVRNATVHAFSVLALEPKAAGYDLVWAIYVLPVNALTGPYMTLINPFRRLLIYPAILRGVRRRWLAAHAEGK